MTPVARPLFAAIGPPDLSGHRLVMRCRGSAWVCHAEIPMAPTGPVPESVRRSALPIAFPIEPRILFIVLRWDELAGFSGSTENSRETERAGHVGGCARAYTRLATDRSEKTRNTSTV